MRMSERIQRRMVKDRKMTAISLRIPEDVVEDLKEVAPTLGLGGYQALIKAYISRGLRKDLARLEKERHDAEIAAKLRAHGISAEIIADVVGA
jgi:hypothetical protein